MAHFCFCRSCNEMMSAKAQLGCFSFARVCQTGPAFAEAPIQGSGGYMVPAKGQPGNDCSLKAPLLFLFLFFFWFAPFALRSWISLLWKFFSSFPMLRPVDWDDFTSLDCSNFKLKRPSLTGSTKRKLCVTSMLRNGHREKSRSVNLIVSTIGA